MEIEPPDLRFSLPISWHILRFISNNEDKKRLRQVCRNWRAAIDELIGLGLKLSPQNKAKLFDSYIIRQCSSITIQGGAGTLAWYTSPFHIIKLRRVAIHGEISVDNWRCMMEKCQSIEKITIEFQKEPKAGLNNILAWNSWSRRLQFKIDLDCLTRVFMKGAFDALDFQCRAMINIMKTTNIPNLRQLVLIKDYNFKKGSYHFHSIFKNLRTAIRDMKQNCPLFKSFGFVDWNSKYSKMDYWDILWLKHKDALIIQHCYTEWQKIIQLFQENTNLDEVHYDLVEHYSRNINTYARFGNKCIQNTGRYSKNIRALSLRPLAGPSCQLGMYATIKCNSLRLLEKLKTLEIKQRVHQRGTFFGQRLILLHNLKLPPQLEKVSLWSVLVTNKILRRILQQCLQIQEICIRDQRPTFAEVALTRPNIETALDHPTLKILVLDCSCERRMRQLLSTLNTNLFEDQWLILRQKNKPPKEIEICTFRHLPGEYLKHLLHNMKPRRMQGHIQLSLHNFEKAMALVNLNNVTESQLLKFEIGIHKDYN